MTGHLPHTTVRTLHGLRPEQRAHIGNSSIPLEQWHSSLPGFDASMPESVVGDRTKSCSWDNLPDRCEFTATLEVSHSSPCYQAQADSLDRCDFLTFLFTDARTQAFLQRLVTTDRQTFLNDARWTDLGPPELAAITHVLVRLQILELFVDALAFPPTPNLPVMVKMPFPQKFPDRLNRVSFQQHCSWSKTLILHVVHDAGLHSPQGLDCPDRNTPQSLRDRKRCQAIEVSNP